MISSTALTAFVIALIPVVLWRPYIGVLAWAWLGLMSPHRLTWSFAHTLSFVEWIAIATLVGALFSREKIRSIATPTTAVWFLLVGWMAITTLFSLAPGEAWPQSLKVLKIQFTMLVALLLMQRRERIIMLAAVIAASIAFYGVKGGIFTLLRGGGSQVLGPPGSFIEGNTEIGLAMITVFPLLRFFQLQATNSWVRRGVGLAMVLVALAIVGTQSRGALVGGLAIAGFLFLKGRRKLPMALAVMLILPALFVFMPESWHEKMRTISEYEQDRSAMGRINAWGFAWNLVLDRPLVGGGFEAFQRHLFVLYAPDPTDFHDAHSIYFEVLGEHGFVGLFLFLLFFLLAWRTGAWIIRKTRARPDLKWAHDLATMAQVSLVGYCAAGAFLGLAYFDLPYYIVVLLVLTQQVVKQTMDSEAAARTNSPAQPARGLVHPMGPTVSRSGEPTRPRL